ncbi:hypothetical protein [Dendrosporobacter sp. 1207_IL3150]|uniref:hypothetical protein n=1 Tax=Dendrosporobacter sp. 1207_IL3150 TaxID=3084054 RepID=UPI002FD9DECF
MKRNIKPLTPRCGLCKRLYSYRDDDGSGLCLKCRPANSQPILVVNRQCKPTIAMEAGRKMIDDFDYEEIQKQEEVQDVSNEENISESQEANQDVTSDNPENTTRSEKPLDELKVEDIIQPGRYGVSNSQMIPALKKAISEQSLEKLALLKKNYFYTYEKSVRYLKKAEREYIANNLK